MSQEFERGAPRPTYQASSGSGSSAEGGEGIGSLVSGLLKDLQDLVRAEIQLAKTELKEDATGAGKGIGAIAAGAFVGLVGFFYLIFACIHLLDKALEELWLSAGIVSLVLLAIAAILALNGRKKLQASSLKPDQTIETLKEDQQWAKQQISSVKK
jgi:hypothetical protein